MVSQMNPSLPSNSDEVLGLSDEEEIRRWGLAHANSGVGEVLVDRSEELKELGLEDG